MGCRCLFSYKKDGKVVGFLVVYVDDGIFFSPNDEILNIVKEISKEIKFGSLKPNVDRFLGSEIRQLSNYEIVLDCNNYAVSLVNKDFHDSFD